MHSVGFSFQLYQYRLPGLQASLLELNGSMVAFFIKTDNECSLKRKEAQIPAQLFRRTDPLL